MSLAWVLRAGSVKAERSFAYVPDSCWALCECSTNQRFVFTVSNFPIHFHVCGRLGMAKPFLIFKASAKYRLLVCLKDRDALSKHLAKETRSEKSNLILSSGLNSFHTFPPMN